MNREFWSDVLRSGAIIGGVMSLSYVFERYILAFSDMALLKASAIYCIEWFVACVLFIWLLARFTRRRANALPEQMGATYSYLLSYILFASMLSGVLVGVAETLYVSVMGYESYIAGLIGRIDQLQQMYIDMGVSASDMAIFEQYTTQLRYMEQPSIFVTIFSQLQVYAIMGCIPGFIIASVNSRRLRRMRVQK
ncbi:MAG: DUF4199 family protein [Alistipes sp.]|nr:DUF4199 family protein [Alistipes sp.]